MVISFLAFVDGDDVDVRMVGLAGLGGDWGVSSATLGFRNR